MAKKKDKAKRKAKKAAARAPQIVRIYDAAVASQYHKRITDTRSADAVMEHAGDKLRIRARHLDENHDLAIGILDTLVNNIVGTGLTVEPQVTTRGGKPAAKFNKELRALWIEWQKWPEVTRELPGSEAERLICRSWLRDGEVLIQHIEGTGAALKHATGVPYSQELIEADLLPFELTDADRGIVQGVQKNAWGQPVAYHLFKSHPGDALALFMRAERDTKQVPADRITHLKFIRRIRQTRGVSVLHGILHRLDDIKDYEESERIAARVAAALTAFIKRSPDFAGQVQATQGDRSFEMAPGMVFDNLLPGEEVGTIGSNRPNPGLEPFRDAMMRACAAGTGTNPSSISKKYDGSYSAQRQGMVESAPGYAKLRGYFIEAYKRPSYERFVRMAIAAGRARIPANVDPARIYDCDIRGPGMPWIDPLKEVQADIKAIESGLKSRAQVIRDRGGDPAVVDEQIAADTFKPNTTTTDGGTGAPDSSAAASAEESGADGEDENNDNERRAAV